MVVPVRTKIYPIYAPARGLSLNVPAPFLTPQATPDCKNVRFYDQIVQKRTGYSPDTYAGGTITGVPIKLYTYTNEDGTDYEILATTTNILKRTTSDWVSIASNLSADVDERTAMCTMYNSGAFYFLYGNTNDGLFKWDGTTYSHLVEFLVSTGWTSTNWTGSWAAGWTHTTGNTSALSQSTAAADDPTDYEIFFEITGRTAGSLAMTFGGEAYSGAITTSDVWSFTTSSIASLVVTPTSDFDGKIKIIITTGAIAYRPKIVLPYQFRLLIFNYDSFPIGFRYTVATPTNIAADWTGTGSGARNMIQGAGSQIMNAVAIKDYVGVYKDKSISVLDYVGGSSIFATAVHIDGIGLLAQDAIVNLGTSHIFLASDYNIYEWNGGWELIPIGNAIKKYIKENIYKANKSRCFAVPNYERTEVHFFIPIKTEVDETPDYPNRFLTYNWTDKTWALNTVASCSGGGNLNTDGVEKTMIALYSDTTGTVHNYDYISLNDGDTKIDSWFTTPDITIDKQEYKIKRKDYKNVYVDAKGDDLSMQYSTAEGSTDSWSDVDTDTLEDTDVYNLHAFNFATAARNIRFKFANAVKDKTYAVRFVGVEHKDVGRK